LQKVEEIGKDNVKAIIAYNYAPLAYYNLYHYCKKESIPLIPDITEWYLIDGKFTLGKFLRMILHDWRIRFISPRSSNLIVAVDFLKHRFKDRNVLVLPVVSSVKSSPVLKKIVKGETLHITYAGYCGGNFSKELLNNQVKAFASLQHTEYDSQLNIVGISKEEMLVFEPSLEKVFNNSKLRINVLGRLSHTETIKVLQQSHFSFFIRPRNRVSKIGFPGKVKEAFELGLPVITNDTGDLSKYIKNRENGFIIDGNSVGEVSKSLNEILNMSTHELNGIFRKCSESNPFYTSNFLASSKEFWSKV
jgi:glycosyltransferase involved in cell wall biosynthesis